MNDEHLLAPYDRQIRRMWASGMRCDAIATHLYEHAIGSVDPRYRRVDVRFLTGLVDRYLTGCVTPETEQLARERRQLEISEQKQRAAETAAASAQMRALAREVALRWKIEERFRQEEAQRVRDERRQLREQRMAMVAPWSDRDWSSMGLPPEIAERQASWCRHMAALRMRELRLPFTKIGDRLRVTGGRAQQIVEKAQRLVANGRQSPLERYLAEPVTNDREQARAMLTAVEVWTGRATVPPCSAAERETWELYYSMRTDA